MYEDIFMLIFMAVISACISYMLDYGLGLPGADDVERINSGAFLAWWTYVLAKRAIPHEEMLSCKKYAHEDVIAKKARKHEAIVVGRQYFTWQYAFGMCIFCTGFWIAIIWAGIASTFENTNYFPHWLIFITTPVFSHLILRKL